MIVIFVIFVELEKFQIQIKVDPLSTETFVSEYDSSKSESWDTIKRFIHERSLFSDFFSVLSILVPISSVK